MGYEIYICADSAPGTEPVLVKVKETVKERSVGLLEGVKEGVLTLRSV